VPDLVASDRLKGQPIVKSIEAEGIAV